MFVKLVGILVVMSAAIAGVLWVSLELAGAVSERGDGVWYIAFGLAIAALVFVVLATVRSRTRGMVALAATTTVLLVAVVLTYPTDSAPCTPGTEQGATSDADPAGVEDGLQLDDAEVTTDAASSGDCK